MMDLNNFRLSECGLVHGRERILFGGNSSELRLPPIRKPKCRLLGETRPRISGSNAKNTTENGLPDLNRYLLTTTNPYEMFVNTKNKCLYMNHVNIGYQQFDNSELENVRLRNVARKQQQSTLYREFEDRLRLTSTKQKAAAHATKQGQGGTGTGNRKSVNQPTNLRVNIETNDRRDLELLDNARDYLRELIESRNRSRVPPPPCTTPVPSRPYTPTSLPRSRVSSARKSRDHTSHYTQRAQTARTMVQSKPDESRVTRETEPPRPQSATSTAEIMKKYGIEDNGAGHVTKTSGTSTEEKSGDKENVTKEISQVSGTGVNTKEEERCREEAIQILKGYRRVIDNCSRQVTPPLDSGYPSTDAGFDYPSGETGSDDDDDDESIDIEMSEPETQVERDGVEERAGRTLNQAERAFFQRHANAAGASYPINTPPAKSRAELRTKPSPRVQRHKSTSRGTKEGKHPDRRPCTPTLGRSRSFLSTTPRQPPSYQPPSYQPDLDTDKPSWPSANDIMRLRAGGFAYKVKVTEDEVRQDTPNPGHGDTDEGVGEEGCGEDQRAGSPWEGSRPGTPGDWGNRGGERPKTPGGTRMDPIIVPSHTTDECPLCAVYYNGDDQKNFHFLHQAHASHGHATGSHRAAKTKPHSQTVNRVSTRDLSRQQQSRESVNPGICSWTDLDKMKMSHKARKTNNNSSSSSSGGGVGGISSRRTQKVTKHAPNSWFMKNEAYNVNSFPYRITYVKVQENSE